MDDGILVTPGIPVARIVEAFEESFGPVRGQVIPCDNSIQLEDVSQLLSYEAASSGIKNEQADSDSLATPLKTGGLFEANW